mmetsp:Transcript_5976/g.14457  ORF Transcript_5976/g.14457 Transcript_5976/m.14457 type:complete len:220 (-) Transcript_5976:1234-1893(-)
MGGAHRTILGSARPAVVAQRRLPHAAADGGAVRHRRPSAAPSGDDRHRPRARQLGLALPKGALCRRGREAQSGRPERRPVPHPQRRPSEYPARQDQPRPPLPASLPHRPLPPGRRWRCQIWSSRRGQRATPPPVDRRLAGPTALADRHPTPLHHAVARAWGEHCGRADARSLLRGSHRVASCGGGACDGVCRNRAIAGLLSSRGVHAGLGQLQLWLPLG